MNKLFGSFLNIDEFRSFKRLLFYTIILLWNIEMLWKCRPYVNVAHLIGILVPCKYFTEKQKTYTVWCSFFETGAIQFLYNDSSLIICKSKYPLKGSFYKLLFPLFKIVLILYSKSTSLKTIRNIEFNVGCQKSL